MFYSGRYFALFSFSVFCQLQLLMVVYSQDVITFSPDVPLCVGDRVEMVCYVESPANEVFSNPVALVSLNGSSPIDGIQINGANTIDGIDLGRYSADTGGLNPTTDRAGIRLIITSYLPYDSDTTFQCYGVFTNFTTIPATVFGMPMRTADPITALECTSTISLLSNYSIYVSCSVTRITSNRGLAYTFTLRNGSTVLEIVPVVTDSLTPNVTFSTTFTIDVCYSVTVSVKNCANQGDGPTTQPTYFNLLGVRDTTGSISPSSTNSTRIEWMYNTDTSCPNKEAIVIPEDLFSFNLINNNSIVYNITEFTLYLPQRFDFYIPTNYDLSANDYFLGIRLGDEDLTDQDIPILIVITPGGSVYVTIILGVLAGLLTLLFIIIILLIVLFLVFFFYKRSNPTK